MIDVRDRLTERITKARLKLELSRALRPAIVCLLFALIALGIWGQQISEMARFVVKSSDELRFAVADAKGVVPGKSEVRFKGVPMGTITDVELEDGRAVLTAKVFEEVGPVYRDARADLRPSTALQDMYIDILDRGSEAAGSSADSADPLPVDQTDTPVHIEEVLQVFEPRVRERLATLLRDLGVGLDGRGDDLRQAFAKVVPLIDAATQVTDQLAERSARTRRLVTNFAALARELERRDEELHALLSDGGKTMEALAESSGALDATLRELPPTLAEMDGSLAAVSGVLPDVDEALTSLRPVVDKVPDTLETVRQLTDDADPAIAALHEPVRNLVPLARELRPFSSRLAETVGFLGPQTGAIDHVTESTAGCVFPALYGFFHWTSSVVKWTDARGAIPRGDAQISIASSPATVDPDERPVGGCAPGMPIGGGPR